MTERSVWERRELQWMAQAEARWSHLPEGPDRDARVRATFRKIELEAEEVTVGLPELTRAEEYALWDEAIYNALLDLCGTDDVTLDVAPFVIDHATLLYRCLVTEAKVKKNPRAGRILAARRFTRKMLELIKGE